MYPPPTPPPPSPPLPPLARAAATRWYHRATTTNTTVVTTHHGCRNGKAGLLCDLSFSFFSFSFVPRRVSSLLCLLRVGALFHGLLTAKDDPGKRVHSRTHPHARVSQAPTRVSHLRTNRLRTTESPAARVTGFKYRDLHHAAMSAVDSSSLSSTTSSPPLPASAFGQWAGAAAEGERGNRQVMWPPTSGENGMILAKIVLRPRTRMSAVGRDHCGDDRG